MAKDKTKKKNKTLKKIILAVVITLLGMLLIVAGVFLGITVVTLGDHIAEFRF